MSHNTVEAWRFADGTTLARIPTADGADFALLELDNDTVVQTLVDVLSAALANAPLVAMNATSCVPADWRRGAHQPG